MQVYVGFEGEIEMYCWIGQGDDVLWIGWVGVVDGVGEGGCGWYVVFLVAGLWVVWF